MLKSVEFSTLDKLMEILQIPTIEEQIKDLVVENKLSIVDQNDNVLYHDEIKKGLGITSPIKNKGFSTCSTVALTPLKIKKDKPRP